MLCSAAASIITGTALVATRYAVPQTDGLTLAMLRYVLATACLLPIAVIFYRVAVARRDFLFIAAFGVLYFCIFPWCISAAMQFTTASGGAIVLACTPAVTLILASLWGSEVLSMRKSLGVTLAILGAATAIGGITGGFGRTDLFGDALMVLATICGAIYAVFSKQYLAKYPPVVVTAIAMGAGATVLVVLWLVLDFPAGLSNLNGMGWLAILYIGVAGGALSFFLYAWALGRASPTATMIPLPLNPIAAIFTGSLFLAEPLSWNLFFGFGLVVTGIFLVINLGENLWRGRLDDNGGNHEIPSA